MKIDLTGKKALVGGSSKGIGLGIATELANSGNLQLKTCLFLSL